MSEGWRVEGEVKEGTYAGVGGAYPAGTCGHGKNFVFIQNEMGTTGGL